MTDTDAWCPAGWERHIYRHADHAHAFYVVDRGGHERALPSVLLMHEFPGISDHLVPLVHELSQDFRVVIPSILGRDGDPTALDSVRQICVRREVHVFARHGSSSAVGWLLDFAGKHVARGPSVPYGVIGMCFTGNFALALAVDPRVTAAVVAQPATPVWPRALGLTRDDRDELQARTDLAVQGYRYRRDCLSPAAKLESAQRLLGSERMRTFPLSGPDERKHSTLTLHRSEAAIAAVREFLRERLTVPR